MLSFKKSLILIALLQVGAVRADVENIHLDAQSSNQLAVSGTKEAFTQAVTYAIADILFTDFRYSSKSIDDIYNRLDVYKGILKRVAQSHRHDLLQNIQNVEIKIELNQKIFLYILKKIKKDSNFINEYNASMMIQNAEGSSIGCPVSQTQLLLQLAGR